MSVPEKEFVEFTTCSPREELVEFKNEGSKEQIRDRIETLLLAKGRKEPIEDNAGKKIQIDAFNMRLNRIQYKLKDHFEVQNP